MEEGEALGKEGEQNDAAGPYVDGGGLLCAFEQHFGGAEAARAGTVGAAGRAVVCFRVRGRDGRGVVRVLRECARVYGVCDPVLSLGIGEGTCALVPVCALAFGKSKVNEHAPRVFRFIEEVGRLDVAVQNPAVVDGREGREEAVEVRAHAGDGHAAEVVPEVAVLKVGENSDHLVMMPEGSDEGADRFAAAEVVEQVEFVEDSEGAACYVYFLDGDVAGGLLFGLREPGPRGW